MLTDTAAPSTCLALAYRAVSPLARDGQCATLRATYRAAALELILRGTALISFTLLLQLDLCSEKSGEAPSAPYLQFSYRRAAEKEARGQCQHSNRETETFKYTDFECPYFWASKITHCKED